MALGDMTDGKLRILKAVATLLEDPSAKVTINNIAKTIQVTDAAIYRHYKSKEDIFAALLAYMETNLLGVLDAVQQEDQSTAARLSTVFHQYMDFIEGHPGLARLLLGHGATEAGGVAERVKMLHAKMRSGLSQILRHAVSKGEIQSYVSPEQGTELFYGMITAAAMAYVYGFPMVDLDGRWDIFSKSILVR